MQEQIESFVVLPAYTQMHLIKLIQATYKSQSTQQIQEAEKILMNYLNCRNFVADLFVFFDNDKSFEENITFDEQFKTAAAILIKKYSYIFSKKKGEDKNQFIQRLFLALTKNSTLSAKIKELLGVALEYVLNHDEICQYKPKVILKLIQMYKSNQNQDTLLGLTIIGVACLNSLIEVQQQLELLMQLKEGLVLNLVKIIDYIKSFHSQNFPFQSKKVFDLCKRIFDFIQLAISRVVEEQDGLEESVNKFRKDQALVDIYYQFLAIFNNDKSIISKTVPQINPIKEVVVELIFQLYKCYQMPQNLFNLFFLTFLLQSSIAQYDDVQQHIVCRVLQILQKYLNLQYFPQIFENHKLQILISLLMYSATKPEELQLIQEQPQKFVQIAQEYTQTFANSLLIKVRAACFLKVYATKIDSSLRNILQIVVIIITAALQASQNQSPCKELYNNIKSEFPKFPFFQLSIQYQLETCFMILCVVSPLVNRREDLQKVVYALLITHMQTLNSMTNNLALLRFIRLISYYPTAVYYVFIKMKMNNGRAFFLQGLQAFERVLKHNKYPQIFQLLAQIFSQISSSINVNDPIFQIILLNHYERMLKNSLPLFHTFLTKLRDNFIQNADKKQHVGTLSLSYIESLIRKQKQPQFKKQILVYFYSMEDYLIKLLDFYKDKKMKKIGDQREVNRMINIFETYEDKVTQIYCVVAKTQTHVSQKSLQFAINSLQRLNQYHSNSSIFQFYNNVLLKIDRQMSKSKPFYNAFMQQIKIMFQNPKQPTKSVQLLPHISLLTSLILSCFSEVSLSLEDLMLLLKIADTTTQQNRQYLFGIILTYMHVQPSKVRSTLIQNNIYESVLKVMLTTNYEQKIFKKIFLIAMVTLLQIEDTYFQDVVKKCIQYFKEQSTLINKNIKKIPQIDPKLRRYFQQNAQENEQCMEEQNQKKKINLNLGIFNRLKHPIQSLSEYDQFKIRIWQNLKVIEKLSPQQKNDLKQILQCDWVGQSLRKIVAIKNNQPKNNCFI